MSYRRSPYPRGLLPVVFSGAVASVATFPVTAHALECSQLRVVVKVSTPPDKALDLIDDSGMPRAEALACLEAQPISGGTYDTLVATLRQVVGGSAAADASPAAVQVVDGTVSELDDWHHAWANRWSEARRSVGPYPVKGEFEDSATFDARVRAHKEAQFAAVAPLVGELETVAFRLRVEARLPSYDADIGCFMSWNAGATASMLKAEMHGAKAVDGGTGTLMHGRYETGGVPDRYDLRSHPVCAPVEAAKALRAASDEKKLEAVIIARPRYSGNENPGWNLAVDFVDAEGKPLPVRPGMKER